MTMITKRHVLVLILCATMVFAAGCAGWGTDGPANSGDDNGNETAPNETTGSDSAPNETQPNTSDETDPNATGGGSDAPATTNADGDDGDGSSSTTDSGDSGSSDSSDSSSGPTDSSSDANVSGTSDSPATDETSDDGSQSPTGDSGTDGTTGSDNDSGCPSCGGSSDDSAPDNDSEPAPTEPNESTGNEMAPNETAPNESTGNETAPEQETHTLSVITRNPSMGDEQVSGVVTVNGETKHTMGYHPDGDEGAATFELPDGTYTVTAAKGSEAPTTEQEVTIDGQDVDISMSVIDPDAPGAYTYSYTVQVADENGEPIEGEEIRIGTPGEDGHPYTTDGNGEVTDTFFNSSPDDVVEQEVVVRGESHYIHVERGPQTERIVVPTEEPAPNESANESAAAA